MLQLYVHCVVIWQKAIEDIHRCQPVLQSLSQSVSPSPTFSAVGPHCRRLSPVEFLRDQSAVPLSAARRVPPGSVSTAAVCRPSRFSRTSPQCRCLAPVDFLRDQSALSPSVARRVPPGPVRSAAVWRPLSFSGVSLHCRCLLPVEILRDQSALALQSSPNLQLPSWLFMTTASYTKTVLHTVMT